MLKQTPPARFLRSAFRLTKKFSISSSGARDFSNCSVSIASRAVASSAYSLRITSSCVCPISSVWFDVIWNISRTFSVTTSTKIAVIKIITAKSRRLPFFKICHCLIFCLD